MIVVAVVILVGVFFVATGRGGEMAYEQADHAPLDLGPVSATDVALLRPPTAMWGYNMQVTDEALERIAQAVRDRDVTIAFLQQRIADLTAPTAPVSQPTAPVSQPAAPVSQPAAPVSQPAAPVSQPAAPVSQPAAPVSQPAAPVSQPAGPPRAHLPQHTRPAAAGAPPGPEHPAEPADPQLAPEEQPR
jgi:hypothetical protein